MAALIASVVGALLIGLWLGRETCRNDTPTTAAPVVKTVVAPCPTASTAAVPTGTELYRRAKVRLITARPHGKDSIAQASAAIGRDADWCAAAHDRYPPMCTWDFGSEAITVTENIVTFTDEIRAAAATKDGGPKLVLKHDP